MPLSIGCCGFPVAKDVYFSRFQTVELNAPFYALPRLTTARKWREEAPEGFEFSLKAWQVITHPAMSPTYRKLEGRLPGKPARCGFFQDTDEVRSAWERTAELARVLQARFILFQTPASFHPSADHIRALSRFFKRARREGAAFVWEPRGSWDERTTGKVCKDLGLLRGGDPLLGTPSEGSVRYFRLHGRGERGRLVYDHAYSDEELSRLAGLCGGKETFVYFNNSSMWEDARRFQDLRDGSAHVRLRGTVPARR
ncbi:MAG TPA: DUF72 domain-containing protein [Elusimicrobia bacterium]|nr:DUF72 domain-containing protein [Elusimicrobiota bacterium]